MITGYHVDRSRKLKEGQVINRSLNARHPVQYEAGVDESFRELFADGFSEHGLHYLIDYKDINSSHARCMLFELVCDYVRLALPFPNENRPPSRYVSFFAFETIDEARNFRASDDKAKNCPIFEVQSNFAWRGDMSLMKSLPDMISLPLLLHCASEYWKGNSNKQNPMYELLLSCPVSIGKIIC